LIAVHAPDPDRVVDQVKLMADGEADCAPDRIASVIT
jgi:hypothetical protein